MQRNALIFPLDLFGAGAAELEPRLGRVTIRLPADEEPLSGIMPMPLSVQKALARS